MKKREEENSELLHCRNCDGYYDPTLPNCPHCGEETSNNINSAGDSALGVAQYGGGFGEAGSPLARTAMLIIIVLMLVALVVIIVMGVQALSSMAPALADSSVSAVESTPPESSQEPEEQPTGQEEEQQPDEPEEEPEEGPEEVSSPESIELKYYDLTLVSGETQSLSPTVTPGDWEGDLTFTTDNKNVATVDGEGNVTYVGGGDCYITVSSGETESKKCIIRCKGSAAGSAGGSQSVTGHYTGSGLTSNNDEPEETKAPEAEEPVQEEPKQEEPVQEEEPKQEEPKQEEPEQEEPASSGSVTLDLTDVTLVHIGDGYQFVASGGNGSYTWSSSNPSVASVSSSGFVTAVGSGKATITCSSGGATITAIVRVK